MDLSYKEKIGWNVLLVKLHVREMTWIWMNLLLWMFYVNLKCHFIQLHHMRLRVCLEIAEAVGMMVVYESSHLQFDLYLKKKCLKNDRPMSTPLVIKFSFSSVLFMFNAYHVSSWSIQAKVDYFRMDAVSGVLLGTLCKTLLPTETQLC